VNKLSDNLAVWSTFFPTLGLMNRYFTFDFAPYNLNSTDFPTKLDIHVSLYGTNKNDTNSLLTIAQDIGIEKVYCPKNKLNVPCSEELLVYEDRIEFYYYQIEVSIPNGNQSAWIGDIKFTLNYGNTAFSSLEISLRFLFMISQVVILILFVLKTKNMKFINWQWEQKATLILIFGAILFNNPFYGFKYAVKGYFFPLLNEFFVTIFHSILLLFWLIASERIRMTELHLNFWLYHIPKLVAVCIFGVLEIFLFSWISMIDQADPVFFNHNIRNSNSLFLCYWNLDIYCSLDSNYYILNCSSCFQKEANITSIFVLFNINSFMCYMSIRWNFGRSVWTTWKNRNELFFLSIYI